MKYKIKCNNCGNVSEYKQKIKKSKYCLKCRPSGMRGRKHSDSTKQKLSEKAMGVSWEDRLGKDGAKLLREKRKLRKGIAPYKITDETRKKMSDAKLGDKCVWKGKAHSIETRKKMSESNSGKNAVWYGKRFSEEHKQKLREAKLKQVRTKYGGVFFNPSACEYFKNLEKENGWDGYYATKNDEAIIAGYSVDYYEPTQNVIIEYDEPHHYTLSGELKARDRERQKIIMLNSSAKFYRYNEVTGELNEYSYNHL